MSRPHFSRKLCIVTMASLLLITFLALGYFSRVLSTAIAFHGPGNDKPALQLLHVLYRHGPRTPADTYPNDPHFNETFYPYGWGHVTNAGKRELFELGTRLRKRYSNFIDTYYQPDMVHAQATGVARTHMSLQTLLAGMFPPKNTPMAWNPKFNWQPIPVYSQPLNEDSLLLVRTPCPRYFEALYETLESPDVKAELISFEYLFTELTELTGLNITEPEDIQSLFLTLLAEQEYGLKLPSWTKEYFPGKMQFLAEQSYVYNVWTPEMQKIKGGPFLTKMFTEMQNKAKGNLAPAPRKLYIYSGHDSTVVNIMAALKIWQRQMPRYSAMTIFELHLNQTTGQHYVEIYFSNHPKDQLQQLTVPGCDFQCPLEQLIELSEEVLIDDIRDANRCQPKNEVFTEPPLRGP